MTLQTKPSKFVKFQTQFDWSLQCAAVAERDIYRRVMGASQIKRYEKHDVIDKELGIDVVFTTRKNKQIALAERFRSADKRRYHDLTIRFALIACFRSRRRGRCRFGNSTPFNYFRRLSHCQR